MPDPMKPLMLAMINSMATDPDLLLLQVPTALWRGELVESCLSQAPDEWLETNVRTLIREAAEAGALTSQAALTVATRCPDAFVDLAESALTPQGAKLYGILWDSDLGKGLSYEGEALARKIATNAPRTFLSLPPAILQLCPEKILHMALLQEPAMLPQLLRAGVQIQEDAVVNAATAAPEVYSELSVLHLGDGSPVRVRASSIAAGCWAALSAHPDPLSVAPWVAALKT